MLLGKLTVLILYCQQTCIAWNANTTHQYSGLQFYLCNVSRRCFVGTSSYINLYSPLGESRYFLCVLYVFCAQARDYYIVCSGCWPIQLNGIFHINIGSVTVWHVCVKERTNNMCLCIFMRHEPVE